MKANRHAQGLRADDGAVGIGTMIVFIATILVASVAAAVLIETSGVLQERSQKTGLEATREVSSNLFVKGIVGKRDGTTASDKVKDLNITVSLAPGSPPVDLEQLVIEINDGSTLKRLNHSETAGNGNFTVEELRDEDGSFASSNPVLTAGDLVQINIDLDATSGNNMELESRTEIGVTLIPESGTQIRADFTTPASFGTSKVVRLR